MDPTNEKPSEDQEGGHLVEPHDGEDDPGGDAHRSVIDDAPQVAGGQREVEAPEARRQQAALVVVAEPVGDAMVEVVDHEDLGRRRQ